MNHTKMLNSLYYLYAFIGNCGVLVVNEHFVVDKII